MSDPTQFIVALPVAHRLLIHEGVLASGRDFFTESPCTLHHYTDTFKRAYVMQLFDALDSDTISCKLSSIAKYSHSAFLPNVVRPLFLATRKTQKTSFELAIFYGMSGIGDLTLEELISAKKSHGEKFEAE
jgi:hypothetical protein